MLSGAKISAVAADLAGDAAKKAIRTLLLLCVGIAIVCAAMGGLFFRVSLVTAVLSAVAFVIGIRWQPLWVALVGASTCVVYASLATLYVTIFVIPLFFFAAGREHQGMLLAFLWTILWYAMLVLQIRVIVIAWGALRRSKA